MSQIITNSEGDEIEVFTSEELEAQKEEAIEQFKVDNPDKTDELLALQEELKTKEEAFEKLNNKDKNFVNLRKAKDEAEKKIEEILKGVDEKINKAKSEVFEGVMKDHYNDTLKALAGEDTETLKKIEHHYKRLGDSATTKSEITNKLRDAYLLATKQEDSNLSSSAFSSAGAGGLKFKGSEKKFNEDEKDLASKFGLTEKDLK